MKQIKKVLALTLAFAMVFTFAACGQKKEEEVKDTSPIKIGSIQDLTGQSADAGLSAAWGAQYAVDEINANGGINGRQLELVSMDCAGDVQQAITCYRKLVDEDGCVALIGPAISNIGIALAELTTEDEIPLIGHYIDEAATTDENGKPYPFMFLACPGNCQQSYSLAQYCIDVLGMNSFSALYNQGNAFSVKLVDALQEYVGKNGKEWKEAQPFTFADQDYRAQASKLAAENPDAIFSPNYTYFDALCYTQLREAGYEGAFIGPNTLAAPAAFHFMIKADLHDVYYLMNVDLTKGKVKEVIDKYVAATGAKAMWNVCFGYDDIAILADAFKNVKDVKDGKALAAWIEKSTVESISGTIKMNPETHRPEGMPMFIADYDENKQFRVIATVWQDENPTTAGKIELAK